MRRLPNVSQVIEQAKTIAKAPTREKTASEESVIFTIPAAEGLHALAQVLKHASANSVTFEEVLEYGESLLKR